MSLPFLSLIIITYITQTMNIVIKVIDYIANDDLLTLTLYVYGERIIEKGEVLSSRSNRCPTTSSIISTPFLAGYISYIITSHFNLLLSNV